MLPVSPRLSQRVVRRRRAAAALQQLARIVEVAPGTEPEDNLTRFPVGQLERDLDGRAGIQRGADLVGKVGPGHGRRIPERAIASDELGAVAAERPGHIVNVEERNPAGELAVVGIARMERAAQRIDFRDHVHGRFWPQVAQHPLDIAGCGESSCVAGFVAHIQYRELDRGVERHVNRQRRANAALHMLEDAVAESMAAHVGHLSAAGKRRRRPEVAALLVAQVKGFPARIA